VKFENLPKINCITKNAQKSISIVDAIETAQKIKNQSICFLFSKELKVSDSDRISKILSKSARPNI